MFYANYANACARRTARIVARKGGADLHVLVVQPQSRNNMHAAACQFKSPFELNPFHWTSLPPARPTFKCLRFLRHVGARHGASFVCTPHTRDSSTAWHRRRPHGASVAYGNIDFTAGPGRVGRQTAVDSDTSTRRTMTKTLPAAQFARFR